MPATKYLGNLTVPHRQITAPLVKLGVPKRKLIPIEGKIWPRGDQK
jgi:hypothetical protein